MEEISVAGATKFSEALELRDPWYVERSEFDAGERSLILDLGFNAGGSFACGACGERGCKAYDTARKERRHLDFLQYRTYVRAPHPRVECPRCGVRQAGVPWARPRSAYTLAFEFRVSELLALNSRTVKCKDVAEFLEEPASRLASVVRHYSKPGQAG